MADLTAPIKEVTVYADRALVTRKGEIHLSAGEQEVRVNDLPQFLRETLRATGQGPQGTRILQVDISKTFYDHTPETEILALETACDLLKQKIDLLQARQAALNDRRQWLRALGEQSRDFARGLAAGQMKPQDCADFFRFTANQALQDAEAAQDLDIQLKQLQLELHARQRELASKKGRGKPDRLAAIVIIDMPEEGDFTLELSYLITQASWQPQYDVRVTMNEDGNGGEVELSYIGLVQQSTGENWEQVSLALSTARPSQVATLPELEPRYLHALLVHPHAVPASPSGVRPMLARKAMQSHAIVADGSGVPSMDQSELLLEPLAAQAPAPAEIATATVEQTGTTYVFRIAHSGDIPSDNQPHKTTIARDNLPCEFEYLSAPAIEQTVHVRARITNTTERVLLPGSSSIFLGNDYVGTTKIKMTSPREQLKIFVGIDDTIKVKREQLERTVEKGVLLQNDLRRITYTYRITLHNYATSPRAIILRDNLPISQHERIKVKTQTIQPAPTERTKLERMTWRFPLAPDEEYKVEYRFLVEHPQDMQVAGLP